MITFAENNNIGRFCRYRTAVLAVRASRPRRSADGKEFVQHGSPGENGFSMREARIRRTRTATISSIRHPLAISQRSFRRNKLSACLTEYFSQVRFPSWNRSLNSPRPARTFGGESREHAHARLPRRDISVADFQTRLKAAIEERDSPLCRSRQCRLGTGSLPANSALRCSRRPIGKVAEDSQNIVYHDDSNINMEQQATEMAKNQMQHNLAVALMVSQFSQMQTAISERSRQALSKESIGCFPRSISAPAPWSRSGANGCDFREPCKLVNHA